MEKIVKIIRALVQDLSTKGNDAFTYDAEAVFNLTESNIISGSVTVYINGVSTTEFSVNYDVCKITITGSVIPGDSIEVYYSYYPQYSDTELEEYIRAVLAYLSVNQVCEEDFKIRSSILFPNPSIRQRRLIALLAGILIEGNLRSYRTPDFTFTFQMDKSKEAKMKDVIRYYKSRAGIFDVI